MNQRIALAVLTATMITAAPAFSATNDPTTTSPAQRMQTGQEAQPSAPTQPASQPNETLGSATGSITPANAQAADVLAKLQQANKMEIEMGNLAKDRARSRDVKAFATQLVQDHTDAQAKVSALAQAQKIDIDAASKSAAQMQKGEQATDIHNDLKNKKGAAFDRAFLTQMVTDHKNNIEALRSALPSLTTSPEVMTLVNDTLPVLERHQQRASELLQKITGSTQPS